MLTSAYLFAWLRALLLTQLVEAPIYRRTLGLGWGRALVPSFVTHPFVWFAFPRLADLGLPYAAWVTVAELAVWLVEAAMLRALAEGRHGHARVLVVSLAGNGASLALGLLADALLGGI